MSDVSLPVIIRFDTTANRVAFTPVPGVPEQLYIWLDSDDQPNAYYWDGANWQTFNAGSATGDVVGPASSTDEALARFDGATGKLLQDSNITLSNTGVLTFPDNIRQIFNPGANAAGINVGAVVATDPDTPVDGDLWYNTGDDALRARINGATVDLGAGSGITQLTGDVTAGPGSGSQAATIANDAVTTVKILNANVTPAKLSNDAKTFSRGFGKDGGGSVVTTGQLGFYFRLPVAATLIRWTLMADLAGDIEFDIFADDPGSTFPPTTSIVAAAPPTLSGADFDDDTTLSGWTTSFAAGTAFTAEITGVPATITKISLQLDFRLS